MRLRITDPALIADLRRHFERSGFITNRFADDTVEVWRPDAPSEEQGRREVEAHFAVWQAMHADTTVDVVD